MAADSCLTDLGNRKRHPPSGGQQHPRFVFVHREKCFIARSIAGHNPILRSLVVCTPGEILIFGAQQDYLCAVRKPQQMRPRPDLIGCDLYFFEPNPRLLETLEYIKKENTNHYDWCVKHHGETFWFFMGS